MLLLYCKLALQGVMVAATNRVLRVTFATHLGRVWIDIRTFFVWIRQEDKLTDTQQKQENRNDPAAFRPLS